MRTLRSDDVSSVAKSKSITGRSIGCVDRLRDDVIAGDERYERTRSISVAVSPTTKAYVM
jgi:hypothetical protein